MATANLNISVTEKRMLNETEAANYCGLPTKHFRTACPVRPVRLAGRDSYDKRDLDLWIDSEKTGATDMTRDSIVARL